MFSRQIVQLFVSRINARTALVDVIERGLTMKRTMMVADCPKSQEGFTNKIPHRIFLIVVACAIALAICPAIYGQATGSFSGNVLDKSGSGVPGATVIATSQGTGLARDVKTDSAGHYLIPLLPVGNLHRARRCFGFSKRRIQRSASAG